MEQALDSLLYQRVVPCISNSFSNGGQVSLREAMSALHGLYKVLVVYVALVIQGSGVVL